MLSALMLLGGLVLLVVGGELLVRGASGIARTLGVSPLIVGLTVVAFGTSAPELAVNVLAAVRGSSTIAFGNVVGSNFANLGLILGLTALLSPLAVQGIVIVREIPMMILATVAMLIMAVDGPLRGEAAVFDRGDGLLLLLFFAVFLYTAVGDVVRQRRDDPLLLQAAHEEEVMAVPRSAWLASALIVLGLGLLVGGGELAVDGARRIALASGMSEAAVAFTLVAIGTSLPELVTCLVAVRRGETDIAVGNVVGSNIFNVLFVLGTTATIRPCRVPEAGLFDLGIVVVVSLLLLPFAATDRWRLVRREGAVLLLIWVGYNVWRFQAA